jgi:hypothetical protein
VIASPLPLSGYERVYDGARVCSGSDDGVFFDVLRGGCQACVCEWPTADLGLRTVSGLAVLGDDAFLIAGDGVGETGARVLTVVCGRGVADVTAFYKADMIGGSKSAHVVRPYVLLSLRLVFGYPYSASLCDPKLENTGS